MRKTQFVSPIIILGIIIISTLIISVQTRISNELQTKTSTLMMITSSIISTAEQDLNYQNQLIHTALELASTINSSGTLTNNIIHQGASHVRYTNEIIINYSKQYEDNGTKRTINNTIILPYPYTKLITEEARFDKTGFRNCMGTDSCSNLTPCINAYDTGTMDWEPITCLTNPLRVKISIKSQEYPLTIDYPYIIYNNSFIIIS